MDDEGGLMVVHRPAASANRASDLDWVAGRIGPRIRARRSELGLSLRELAQRIDVSASFVSLVETGRCPPSVATLCALASELGLSVDELLADPGSPGMSRRRRSGSDRARSSRLP